MMRNLRRAALGVVASGMMSAGGFSVAVAQTDSTPQLDIGAVASELELSEEKAREMAPLLERLNAAFERRDEHWREGIGIRDEIGDAYDEIGKTLSASELREFHWLLRDNAVGTMGGRGVGVRGGARGGAWNRRPAMRGGRGFAGRGVPMRGMRGASRWDNYRYWRPDDFDSNK